MRLLDPVAADRYTISAAQCAGEESQIPFISLHFLHRSRDQDLFRGYFVCENIAVHIGKNDGITDNKVFQLAEVCPIIVRRNDKIALVRRAGIATRRLFQRGIAPLADC